MNKNEQLIQQIKGGKIFIYPTDTIYGIGCNALNKKATEKIKEIKGRNRNKPLSIIAPSIQWIKENCITDNINLNKYLPGPYTLILKKKDDNFLSHISSTNSLGIRIPDNDFTNQVQQAGVPFITTSVNLSGEKPITKTSELKPEIKCKVDTIIDAGELNGNPSILIINGEEIKR